MRRFEACPACGGGRSAVVVEGGPAARQRFLEFSARKYGGVMDDWLGEITLRVRRCADCGHHWYEEQPDDDQLAAMYAAGTRLHPERSASTQPSTEMIAEMGRLRRLLPAGTGEGEAAGSPARPRLLDFGSGHGRWARAAVAAGFDVTAYEPSQARGADDRAAADGFLLVHELSAVAGRRFDAINVEQVLEHVPDPLSALAAANALCHEKTVIRITVPSIDRTYEGPQLWEQWPYDGWRTHAMAPFEHVHGFTARSLDCLLARAGLRPLSPALLSRVDPTLALRRLAGPLAGRFAPTKAYARFPGAA